MDMRIFQWILFSVFTIKLIYHLRIKFWYLIFGFASWLQVVQKRIKNKVEVCSCRFCMLSIPPAGFISKTFCSKFFKVISDDFTKKKKFSELSTNYNQWPNSRNIIRIKSNESNVSSYSWTEQKIILFLILFYLFISWHTCLRANMSINKIVLRIYKLFDSRGKKIHFYLLELES